MAHEVIFSYIRHKDEPHHDIQGVWASPVPQGMDRAMSMRLVDMALRAHVCSMYKLSPYEFRYSLDVASSHEYYGKQALTPQNEKMIYGKKPQFVHRKIAHDFHDNNLDFNPDLSGLPTTMLISELSKRISNPDPAQPITARDIRNIFAASESSGAFIYPLKHHQNSLSDEGVDIHAIPAVEQKEIIDQLLHKIVSSDEFTAELVDAVRYKLTDTVSDDSQLAADDQEIPEIQQEFSPVPDAKFTHRL